MADTALLIWPASPPPRESQHVAKLGHLLVVGALKTIPVVGVGVGVGSGLRSGLRVALGLPRGWVWTKASGACFQRAWRVWRT